MLVSFSRNLFYALIKEVPLLINTILVCLWSRALRSLNNTVGFLWRTWRVLRIATANSTSTAAATMFRHRPVHGTAAAAREKRIREWMVLGCGNIYYICSQSKISEQ